MDEKRVSSTRFKAVSVRMPEELHDGLMQMRYVKGVGLSALIRLAIADWIYWQEKFNEMKLEALKHDTSRNI